MSERSRFGFAMFHLGVGILVGAGLHWSVSGLVSEERKPAPSPAASVSIRGSGVDAVLVVKKISFDEKRASVTLSGGEVFVVFDVEPAEARDWLGTNWALKLEKQTKK